MDKRERKSEESLVMISVMTLPASSRNSFIGSSSSEGHIIARDDVSSEAVASTSQNTLLSSTSSPRISGLLQVLPDRVLRSIVTTSGPRLTLATV